jgi:S-adenosylmethionine synthetase
MFEYTRSAESVTEGHPDKICDGIAASVLDHSIRLSKAHGMHPRVAMEVSAKGDTNSHHGTLLLFGEVTLPKGIELSYEHIARNYLSDIGYTNPADGFSTKLKELIIRISEQSKDIAHGVSKKRTGAGDQGFMIGGAVADGPEYMPMPIMIAHALSTKLTTLRKDGTLPYLKPDGKTQVVVRYRNDRAISIDHITVATAHDSKVDLSRVASDVTALIIKPVLAEFGFSISKSTDVIINGAGAWTVFGPLADAGTTNRKIIVDTYGGYFPHGGGGLNGKDPTKVDLSGALAARFVAKTLVANKLARKVQVNITYTIGNPDPRAVEIETFGTEKVSKKTIQAKAKKALDLSVDGIMEGLHLFQPVYVSAAVGGFFGRPEFPWEQHIQL